jgi:polar amino acid transport system substrate-binding protein
MNAITTVAAVVALLGGGLASAQASPQPLRLCADPANLPFSSNAPQARAQGTPGLYVEIGEAVAQALGRPMDTVWSLSYFGKRNLRSTLLAGQCDLAVGLPATSDFMGPKVIFSAPILQLGYALVLPKGRPARGLDDLAGLKVAVQFGSPPQSLLAQRADIQSVTAMDPEEAMRRLVAGEVDAAFIWAPSAGYINHSELHDAYQVVSVNAPQMQFPAAIGFAGKQAVLRDQVNAVLPQLAPRIQALSQKYAVAGGGTAVMLTDAGPVKLSPLSLAPAAAAATAVTATVATAPAASAGVGNALAGREVFDGTCAHCHGPNAVVADRKINLRLLQRKYGADMEAVFFKTVIEGRPSKGMPTWKAVFSHEDFVNILAFLNTVQDK